MNAENRKRLTMFIGECWHETEEKGGYYKGGGYSDPGREFYVERYQQCKKCHVVGASNRTFREPTDAYAVKDELVRRGLWEKFTNFAIARCDYNNLIGSIFAYACNWLFSPDESGDQRLCVLAGEWLKEGR